MKFFRKLPKITYNNSPSVNIMSRVNMSKLALTDKQAYYDYVLPEGERLDNLSYDYYKDPDFLWLIALTNQIIDPYYEVPLSNDDLNALIVEKYGSISNAQGTILFFRNNWINDESTITVGAYAALPETLKKYWDPELNAFNNIVGYHRKQADWQQTTNKIQSVSVASTTGFVAGESLLQNGDFISAVKLINEDSLTVQHVASNPSLSDPVVGATSGTSTTVSSFVTIKQSIPDDELVYWSAVTAYDYEQELNHMKKNIKLLDSRYAGQAVKELKNLYV